MDLICYMSTHYRILLPKTQTRNVNVRFQINKLWLPTSTASRIFRKKFYIIYRDQTIKRTGEEGKDNRKKHRIKPKGPHLTQCAQSKDIFKKKGTSNIDRKT